jgi:hypothetical protein
MEHTNGTQLAVLSLPRPRSLVAIHPVEQLAVGEPLRFLVRVELFVIRFGALVVGIIVLFLVFILFEILFVRLQIIVLLKILVTRFKVLGVAYNLFPPLSVEK